MEGSDVFAQEISGSEDPFAGTDLDESFGEQPEARPAGEVPVVNREGERVDAPAPAQEPESDPSGGHPTLTPEQAAENAAAYEKRAMGEDPTPPLASAGPTEDPPAAEAGTTTSASEPSPTTPGRGEDPTPPSSADSGGSIATGGDEPVPTPAASSADAGAAPTGPSAGASSSSPEISVPDEEDAPLPEETKDKNNRVTRRRYLIFKVDGPDKLTQVHWHEKGGKLVERGTQGAKRQKVYLARGTDDALKFGYIVAGQPKGGIKLVAVAALHFQPKEVKPKPPEPSKVRLQIN